MLIRYDVPLNGGELKLGLQTDANYRSKVFYSTSNDPLLSQDGFALWNARVSLAPANDRWELSAQVKNITGVRYVTEAFDFSSSGYNLFVYGPPMTWELSATFKF
jgi:iron complex outermembrane receptor protein